MSTTTFTNGKLAGMKFTKMDFVAALSTMGVTTVVMAPREFDDLLDEIESAGMTRPSRIYAIARRRQLTHNGALVRSADRHWWHALIWGS